MTTTASAAAAIKRKENPQQRLGRVTVVVVGVGRVLLIRKASEPMVMN